MADKGISEKKRTKGTILSAQDQASSKKYNQELCTLIGHFATLQALWKI